MLYKHLLTEYIHIFLAFDLHLIRTKKTCNMNQCPFCDNKLKPFHIKYMNRTYYGLCCQTCKQIIYVDNTSCIIKELKEHISDKLSTVNLKLDDLNSKL